MTINPNNLNSSRSEFINIRNSLEDLHHIARRYRYTVCGIDHKARIIVVSYQKVVITYY